jgi:hypothetical protein
VSDAARIPDGSPILRNTASSVTSSELSIWLASRPSFSISKPCGVAWDYLTHSETGGELNIARVSRTISVGVASCGLAGVGTPFRMCWSKKANTSRSQLGCRRSRRSLRFSGWPSSYGDELGAQKSRRIGGAAEADPIGHIKHEYQYLIA